MWMQVGKKKAPKRKFIDGERDDTAALPVVKCRRLYMNQQGSKLLFELQHTIKVTDQRGKIAAQECQRETPGKTVHQRHHAGECQSKQRGNSKVECCGWNNAGQLDQCAKDDVSIVVVNVSTGKPWIIRRHPATPQPPPPPPPLPPPPPP